jgi:transcriptional regulator with PAS, ATPase and Fis domain
MPPEALLHGQGFRSDLFYRLSVIALTIPPLRMRPDDILDLAERIYHELQSEMGYPSAPLPSELAHNIQQHDWPGNVRELRNMLERSMILGFSPHSENNDTSLASATNAFERAWIQRVVAECNDDKAAAAKKLGIGMSTLYRKLEA